MNDLNYYLDGESIDFEAAEGMGRAHTNAGEGLKFYYLPQYRGDTFRYLLERGTPKVSCPSCDQRTATPYMDDHTGEYLPAPYSICDRAQNCGHHANPYTHAESFSFDGDDDDMWVFHDLTWAKYQAALDAGALSDGTLTVTTAATRTRFKNEVRHYIPINEVKRSIDGVDSWKRYGATWNGRGSQQSNGLWRWMAHNAHGGRLEGYDGMSGVNHVTRLCMLYLVGNTTHYKRGGGVVFWYINMQDAVEAAQVISLDANGSTARWVDEKGKKRRLSTWWHSAELARLRKMNATPPHWLTEYAKQQKKQTCMFGQWLLHIYKNKTIALVEAPKTAVIMAAICKDYVWLAVGALSYLTAERVADLGDRPVVLFADAGAEDVWAKRAERAGLNYTVDKSFQGTPPDSLAARYGFTAADAERVGEGADLVDLFCENWDDVDFNAPTATEITPTRGAVERAAERAAERMNATSGERRTATSGGRQ